MLDVTDALRRSLTDHATDAPGAAGLDTRVYARSRRLAWRQRGLAAATAALVLAVAVPVVVYQMAARNPDRQPAAAALQAYSGTRFPARVTYLPPGVADVEPILSIRSGRTDLDYRTADRAPMLQVSVQAADPATSASLRTIGETTVNGVKATLMEYARGAKVLAIAWQRTPGVWTTVTGFADTLAPARVDEAFLRSIAEGITDGTTGGLVPFTLMLIPRGFVVGEIYPGKVRLCPTACEPTENIDTDITVGVVPHGEVPRGLTRVTVGTSTGWFERGSSGGAHLVVELDDGWLLVLSAAAGNTLSDGELFTFAAGVTVTSEGRRLGG